MGAVSSTGAVRGSCLCGAVTFEVTLPSLVCVHCHCSMCRRAHGAGAVTWFSVPPAQLEIVRGQEGLARYRSSAHGTRSFCGRCGSSLFFESSEDPSRIDIALASIEGSIDREPELHVHFSDRISWLPLEDSLPKLGGTTGLEEIEG